jgi:hypothetical protein
MLNRKTTLSNQDHRDMDTFLTNVLDAYKNSEITRESAVKGLAHIMTALDIGNTGEVLSWFRQDGVSFFKS